MHSCIIWAGWIIYKQAEYAGRLQFILFTVFDSRIVSTVFDQLYLLGQVRFIIKIICLDCIYIIKYNANNNSSIVWCASTRFGMIT